MAEVDFAPPEVVNKTVDIVTWPNMLNGDTGRSYVSLLRPDKTLQIVAANFGVGGTILFEGSNDGTNWVTLSDADANLCSFTTEDIVFVREAPYYVRPRVSAGDGDTDITPILVAVTQGA